MRLAKREKIVITAGTAITIILLIYYLWVDPLIEKDKRLDRLIAKKTIDLSELNKLRAVYLKKKGRLTSIDNSNDKQKGFAILSFLEEGANRVGVKNNIKKMKPSKNKISNIYEESSVELKVEGISIQQLIEYLYYIENTKKFLTIKRLRIKKRFKEPHLLDTVFKVSLFEKIDGKS